MYEQKNKYTSKLQNTLTPLVLLMQHHRKSSYDSSPCYDTLRIFLRTSTSSAVVYICKSNLQKTGAERTQKDTSPHTSALVGSSKTENASTLDTAYSSRNRRNNDNYKHIPTSAVSIQPHLRLPGTSTVTSTTLSPLTNMTSAVSLIVSLCSSSSSSSFSAHPAQPPYKK